VTISLEPIGVIHTNGSETEQTPVQTALNWDEPGEARLEAGFELALEGLSEFTHLWLLTWLGRPGQPLGAAIEMRTVPFLLRPTGEAKGALATRNPRRPNPIGLHLVRISSVTMTPPVIYFYGVDMVDGTPLLDVKPWVGSFDYPVDTAIGGGWYERVRFEQTTPADLAGQAPPTDT
jgi:tRNA-Thr(GGU) m(6)t(6)A37 methyltransferase TsaA